MKHENGRQCITETQFDGATVEPGQFHCETQCIAAGLTHSLENG